MRIECDSCGHEWDHEESEEGEEYAACPECEYKIEIPARAQVVDHLDERDRSGEEKKKHDKRIPAKATVVAPKKDDGRFSEEEKQFMDELESCDAGEDIEELCTKYDQQEFNVISKKIKDKAEKTRRDLDIFEKIENILEEADWKYYEL